MSSTSLTTGTEESLPDYNIKNNPSIFNFTSVPKINQIRQILLAISYNREFLNIVLDLKNLGRAYYNKIPRKFCSSINLSSVEDFQNKHITVYLPSAGGVIANSIEYVKMDYTNRTFLTRIVQPNKLPVCWSNRVGANGECFQNSVPPSLLSPNEQVLHYYIKNGNFFTRMLQLLTNSFYNHSIQRFVCYTLELPADLYEGTKQERTFTVTGDFLRQVYSQYLRQSRYSKHGYKLPAPVTIDPIYNIPTTNDTQGELTQYINDHSDSFPL